MKSAPCVLRCLMILTGPGRKPLEVTPFEFVPLNTKTQTAKTAGCARNKIGKLLLGSLVTDQLNADLVYNPGAGLLTATIGAGGSQTTSSAAHDPQPPALRTTGLGITFSSHSRPRPCYRTPTGFAIIPRPRLPTRPDTGVYFPTKPDPTDLEHPVHKPRPELPRPKTGDHGSSFSRPRTQTPSS